MGEGVVRIRAKERNQDLTPIRDAATVILVRDPRTNPSILMGQRGTNAVFMPEKVVFPGGAVDDEDGARPIRLNATCRSRLSEQSDRPAGALAAAAIRELWEETGLALGQPGAWPDPPADWASFAATGAWPDASGLSFVFRAITPPGRPRRFDARLFLVDACHIKGDLDDFSSASEELSHLQWVPLAEARALDLPFITEVVLAETEARAADPAPPASVPFYKNNDEESLFLRMYGQSQPM